MPLAIPEPFRRPLPHEKITPQNTALLVIDMQNDFCAPGAVMETPGAREMVPAINRLADVARRAVCR